MKRTSTFALALALAALAPAAAQAATVHTDAGHVYYDAAPADQVSISVNNSTDGQLGDVVIFPAVQHDPPNTGATAGDATCKANLCQRRNEVDITAGDRDDFVRVDAAPGPVVFRGGGGADRIFASSPGVRLDIFGEAGDDFLQGDQAPAIDTTDGGPGNDLIDPGVNDDVHGGADFDTVRTPTAGATVTLDDAANDGTAANHLGNIHSDVEKLAGGDGPDDLTGSAGADTLDGGAGNDTLNGLAGADTLAGGSGDDTITARDGAADSVTCGPGVDTALVDPADTVSPDCETVVYADADHDGFDARTDCNDANPAVHPGTVDTPGNGVDEDCSGADTVLVGDPGSGTTVITGPADADHDGVSPPVDCNDGSAAIHPGAADTPGDGVDQDCSGSDAQLPPIPARVRDRWTVTNAWAQLTALTVRGVPTGGKVAVDCKGRGCPFARRTVKVRHGRADAGKPFAHRRLKPGTTVQVTITAPGYVGKVMRYRFAGHRKVPSGKALCLPPGALAATSCKAG